MPALEAGPEAGADTAMSEPSARPAATAAQAPYRAEAVRGDGGWHLTVRSLDDHPDRGEVDALVVTVTPARSYDGLPAKDLDRMLSECGFGREHDWARGEEGWTAPCRQSGTRSAPPAPCPDE